MDRSYGTLFFKLPFNFHLYKKKPALFGEINPSGQLPVTFYKSIEQLPDFKNKVAVGGTSSEKNMIAKPIQLTGGKIDNHALVGCRNSTSLKFPDTIQL